jgi:chromosome partitioning protein
MAKNRAKSAEVQPEKQEEGVVAAVVNQKGGVGKTTTVTNLAAIFAAEGNRVIVVDADGQATATRWAGQAEDAPPFQVVNLYNNPQIGREILRFKSEYDIVFVDCPGNLDRKITPAVIAVADLVVIPMRASGFDLWASEKPLEAVQEARITRPSLRYAVLLTHANPRTRMHADMEEFLRESDAPLFNTQIQHRTVYEVIGTAGRTVMSATGIRGAPPARREMMAAAEEIVELLQGTHPSQQNTEQAANRVEEGAGQ